MQVVNNNFPEGRSSPESNTDMPQIYRSLKNVFVRHVFVGHVTGKIGRPFSFKIEERYTDSTKNFYFNQDLAGVLTSGFNYNSYKALSCVHKNWRNAIFSLNEARRNAIKIAFGKNEWNKKFNLEVVKFEPLLPIKIIEVLNKFDPFFPEKKIVETHTLTLIPREITLEILKILIRSFLKIPVERKDCYELKESDLNLVDEVGENQVLSVDLEDQSDNSICNEEVEEDDDDDREIDVKSMAYEDLILTYLQPAKKSYWLLLPKYIKKKSRWLEPSTSLEAFLSTLAYPRNENDICQLKASKSSDKITWDTSYTRCKEYIQQAYGNYNNLFHQMSVCLDSGHIDFDTYEGAENPFYVETAIPYRFNVRTNTRNGKIASSDNWYSEMQGFSYS